MEIAIAKDGFIDINENVVFDEYDDFLSGIRKIFNFEERELQSFDGNTCRIISAHNPVNSIFIYKNPQGTFLYQITSATPFIHLNNMIWNCQTYKMEDIETINKVLETNTFVDMKKNKRNTKAYYEIEKGVNGIILGYKGDITKVINIKDNFEKSALNSVSITNSVSTVVDAVWQTRTPAFTLKIKCLTDLTGMNLQTNASDGSYNFLFPMVISSTNIVGNEKIPKITDKLIVYDWNGSLLQSAVSLADIISTYSESIKSIEVLPFDCSGAEFEVGTKYETFESGEGFYYSNGFVGAKITGQCKATPLGIFVPVGETFGTPIYVDYANDEIDLTFGGGARGFVRTPLGNVELDFNTFVENDAVDTNTGNSNTRKGFKITVKTEGWHIGGLAKCEIPPHYVNFYTDNAGQVFIQNLTTNAQELRQMERETIAKQQEQEQQFVFNTLQKSQGILSNIVTGNIGGILGNLGSIANNVVELEFNKSRNEREYQRSLAEYRDKTKTQSLLASLTGKQISGNINLFDMLQSLDANYFKIFVETNYYKQYANTYSAFSYIIQPDYDYSVDISTNTYYRQNQNLNDEDFAKNVILYTPTINKTTTCQTVGEMIALIFGYEFETTKNFQIDFTDKIGLNYNIVFRLKNFIVDTETNKINFTNILKFPIRRKPKKINYNNYGKWS